MKWIIDRFEGESAVIELAEGVLFSLPKVSLPEGAKEGDVITVEIDADETETRRKRISRLKKRLFVD